MAITITNGAGIALASTTITGGSTGRILYDNAGLVGEMTTTGSGTVVALATSPTLVTPILGVATATSLTLATGQSSLVFSTDLFVGRGAAANIRLGAADVDTAPVAQTISVQNALTGGTNNVAGAALTIAGSQGKGTGVGGNIVLQTAPAGSSGSTVNALATVVTLYGSGDVGIGSGTAIATTATAGFLLIPTCAGTPTGAPPNAGTGKAALIFDTSGSQLWISVSGASWKQPKTPAAAAVVNWQ